MSMFLRLEVRMAAQGIEQGMSRGRVEGERALLRLLLQRRFGVLSPETVERVGRASVRDSKAGPRTCSTPALYEVFDSRQAAQEGHRLGTVATLGEPVRQAL